VSIQLPSDSRPRSGSDLGCSAIREVFGLNSATLCHPSQCCLFGSVWRLVLEFEGIAADETISVVSDLIRAFSLCNGGLIESIPRPMMLGYGTGISWTRKGGCAASPCLDEVEGSPWWSILEELNRWLAPRILDACPSKGESGREELCSRR
jgi:hypothetical protein